MKQVSIIMSEYNTPEYLLRNSIQSILDQTYTNFEFIIINDGSSKLIHEIAHEVNDPRIKVFDNEKNMGLPYSLNRAIDISKNEYILRMDTDDIALPNRVETMIKYMNQNPEYSVVGGSVILYDDEKSYGTIINDIEVDKNVLMKRIVPIHPTVIMKKSHILEVGGYPQYNRSEDLALWCELLLANHKIRIIPAIVLKYHLSDADYKKRTIKTRKDELVVRYKYYRLFNATFLQKLSILKSVLAGLAPTWVIKLFHERKFRDFNGEAYDKN